MKKEREKGRAEKEKGEKERGKEGRWLGMVRGRRAGNGERGSVGMKKRGGEGEGR